MHQLAVPSQHTLPDDPTSPRNGNSFPGQCCSAGTAPVWDVLTVPHIPWECLTCPTMHGTHRLETLLETRAFELNPGGKGTGLSFSPPWMGQEMVHGWGQSEDSRMSQPQCHRLWMRLCKGQGCDIPGIWGWALQPESLTSRGIGTATSGAHSHTRASCSSQITPGQPREDVTAQPHSRCIFRLPAQPRGLEKTFDFVPVYQPALAQPRDNGTQRLHSHM